MNTTQMHILEGCAGTVQSIIDVLDDGTHFIERDGNTLTTDDNTLINTLFSRNLIEITDDNVATLRDTITHENIPTKELSQLRATLFEKRYDRQSKDMKTVFSDGCFRYAEAARLLNRVFSPKMFQFKDPSKTGKHIMIYDSGTHIDAADTFERALLYLGDDLPKKRTRECVYDILTNAPEKTVYHEDVASKINIANFTNGIVDVSGETPLLRAHTSDDIFFSQIPNMYKEDAECALFDEYLECTLDEKYHQFVYEWIGYCMFEAYHLQYILFLHGVPGAGKTTLQNIMEHVVGTHNTSTISLEQMNNETHSTVSLMRKLVNNAGEVHYQDLKRGVGVLNQLSGGDTITVNPKFKSLYSFKNAAKLTFSMNALPKIYTDSDGFYRRVIMVEYKSVMSNGDIKKFLASKNGVYSKSCIEGIISKSIRAYHKLVRSGAQSFCIKTNYTDVGLRYQTKSDPITEFVYDCITFISKYKTDPNTVAFIPNSEIYQCYIEWCNKKSIQPYDYKKFGSGRGLAECFKNTDAQRNRYNSIRGWEYIELHSPLESDGFQYSIDTGHL